MTIRCAVIALLAMLPVSAMADEVSELSEHLGKAVGAFEATRLYAEQCDGRDLESAGMRRDALAAWSYENARADYDRVMTGLTQRLPDLAPQLDAQTENLARLITEDLDQSPEQCADFATLLDDDQFDVEHSVRRLLSLSRNLGIDIPPEPQITPRVKTVEETEIVRLATLSAWLEDKMAEIGSREGAQNSSALRRARGDHAEAWLEADGIQILFGRVTDADEMREWRDDMQSVFEVECDSFFDDAHEERMAASIGTDMVVLGTPRIVIDSIGGGTVSLSRCSLFTVEETGRPFRDEDDTAGLTLRPLEFEEAYAGPNQGISLGDVDRVLYQSSFDNRMDGFGNGYIDRQEDIYVLLRDGSAYRHEWSFAFTDLSVERSRHREPERWFTWTERDGTVSLTGTDGETIDLAGAQRLEPFAPRMLQAEYYYLQIGMGGARSDRRYAFAEDGTVVYSRGGFVAGNFATSYIIVTGEDDPDVRARYRFEDYSLILETAEGEERHFLAVPQSADQSQPDTLLIDGTAFWLDDDD